MAIIRPLNIVMDVTERCNLRCVMCYFSKIDRIRFPPFDRELSSDGNMPVEVFEQIASQFFPRARRVALACTAEPLIHPRFSELLGIARRHRIKDLWFPTNLLPLTESKARAIVESGVRTVAVSIDGTQGDLYESIRTGARWDMLHKRLQLLNRVRDGSRTRLRIIYTWMRANRDDLLRLPEFAARVGAYDLDVRSVVPTNHVDNADQILEHDDPEELAAILTATARDAVRRGLKLAYYPEFEDAAIRPQTQFGRIRRAHWRWRAGLNNSEAVRVRWFERLNGCSQPKRTYVIRPNGAVLPCIFWDQGPLGLVPTDSLSSLAGSSSTLLEGLRAGDPVGTCKTCQVRRDAFFQPVSRARARRSDPAPR